MMTSRAHTLLWTAILALAAAGAFAADSVPLAYVANAGNNHIQVLDLESGKTLRKIYAGTTPWRLLLSADRSQLWAQHWYSATTAVIDLDDHEVLRVLPLRGPGVFVPGGERFLSFSWPLSTLHQIDASTFAELSQYATDIRWVYDFVVSRNEEALNLVQFDPMARGPRKVYAYVVSYPWAGGEAEKPKPLSLSTGRDPRQVRQLKRHPFLLTADHGTNGLSLINELRDGRAVTTCPAPRSILFSPDETRMVVVCWRGYGARRSEVWSYVTDFSKRPWPDIHQEDTLTVEGAVVAGAFSPAGDRIYLAERTGKLLLEVDAETLEVLRTFPTGDEPMDVAVVAVPAAVRDRLPGESRARRIARQAIARLRQHGAPFTNVSWKETITWHETAPAAESAAAEEESAEEQEPPKPELIEKTRQLKLYLDASGALRSESEEGRVRLAQDGRTLALDGTGRFWVTPRQELVSVVYALPNLSPEEALRHLAGDVPGSPFLHTGLAIDVAAEVEQEDRRIAVIGAFAEGARVSQLWVEAETGRPINLVEQIPTFRSGSHEAGRFTGLVETRFGDFTDRGGRRMPARLQRVIDGQRTLEVRLEDVRFDRELPEGRFSLSRLGGAAASSELIQPVETRPAPDGPGRAVPILGTGYLGSPWQPHPPYNSNPPTSGARVDQIADWGVHEVPVPLVLQVDNLEHGGVLVQYNCSRGCPELVAALAGIVRRYDQAILAPYPLMEARIALTAWGRIATFDELEEERIVAFIEAYAGRDHRQLAGGLGPLPAH